MIGLGWRCLFKKNDSVLWMPFGSDPNYVSCLPSSPCQQMTQKMMISSFMIFALLLTSLTIITFYN